MRKWLVVLLPVAGATAVIIGTSAGAAPPGAISDQIPLTCPGKAVVGGLTLTCAGSGAADASVTVVRERQFRPGRPAFGTITFRVKLRQGVQVSIDQVAADVSLNSTSTGTVTMSGPPGTAPDALTLGVSASGGPVILGARAQEPPGGSDAGYAVQYRETAFDF